MELCRFNFLQNKMGITISTYRYMNYLLSLVQPAWQVLCHHQGKSTRGGQYLKMQIYSNNFGCIQSDYL